MLQRLLILMFLSLAACMTLDHAADAQTAAQNAVDILKKMDEGIMDWTTDNFKRIADDLQKQDTEWKNFRLSIDGIALEGENKYIEATQLLESAVREHESSPERNPIKQQLNQQRYLNDLYMLASIYAEMSEFEKAEKYVERAWRAQLARDGASKTTLASRIRGLLMVASVLHKCDKPHEAAKHVDICKAWCDQLPKALYQAEENSLLAACLLAKAEIANSTGQHHAALDVAGQAVKMLKATGSKRHPDVAAALHCQSVAALQLDRGIEAFDLVKEAKGILEKYFDKGHPSRAAVYRTMAQLQFIRGNELDALNSVRLAVAELERIFPECKYKRGHPGLFQAMTALGDLLVQYSRVDDALVIHRTAWQKCQQFYPRTHVHKLASLLSYARSLRAGGQLSEALTRFQEAEALACELDTAAEKGEGANVAQCLVERGLTEARLGEQGRALATLDRSLDIYKRLTPPRGNPQIATALHVQGTIYYKRNEMSKARTAFKQAIAVDQQALERFAGVAAEAEAMSFRGTRDQSYHAYLLAGADPDDVDAGYAPVWIAKATVTRLLQKRRAAIRLAQESSAEVRQLQDRLIDVRTQLGRLIRSRRETGAFRDEQLEQLKEEKESLERRRAKAAPALAGLNKARPDQPDDLAKRLPTGSVFVDLVSFGDFLTDETPRGRYAAFVVAPGQAARRVDLGLAAPINRAIKEWRESMKHWHAESQPAQQAKWQRVSDERAAEIRRLVWAPIAACFPPHTRLVYVAPDGDLCRFPLTVLPGSEAGKILLEEVMIAEVPHGPFLLDNLHHAQTSIDKSGAFLAVGGIEYDSGALAGAAREIKTARQLAGARATKILEGKQATCKAVGGALTRARYAHLATHGFLAEKRLAAEHEQVARFLRAWQNQGESAAPSLGLGRRSPLSYTGLVLAGAGQSNGPMEDDGILSGETIAELPLDQLRLVVLSACETGLGEATAGEGVQGLPRAFHLAGCPNVVATLWPVDDTATQILMAEFYRQLWDCQQSPLEALFLAQRALYRDPRLASANGGSVHPKFWAAFVYSGSGVPFVVNPDDPHFGSVAGVPSSASAIGWTIGALAILGFVGAALSYRWRRQPLPVATIIGPADETPEGGHGS